jgi:hypothetical protein
MPKKKTTIINAGGNLAEAINELVNKKQDRPYFITEAVIKDGFCNFIYQITEGMASGETHKVNGVGIAKDSLLECFTRLRVHLAAIDDVFKHSGIEFEDINEMHGDELTQAYHVTGIKIRGGASNESVIIVGNKYVSSTGGRIEITTPRVPLDELSSYEFSKELKNAIDTLREEVSKYKEGNYDIVEEDTEEENPKQLKITDNIEGDQIEDEAYHNAGDVDFENAKV